MDDELMYDLPEELNELLVTQEVYLKILKEWKILKSQLTLKDIQTNVDKFDKLLKYFFE